MTLRVRLLLLALLLPIPHGTATADDTSAGRDPSRLSIGFSAAVFANYPGAVSDLGVAGAVVKPLWLGRRYRYAQLDVGAILVGGWGTESGSAYVSLAPVSGLNLFFGDLFGFELRGGPALVAQLGDSTVLGGALLAQGGYVVRPWQDDRRRLKLLLTMQVGAYAASDPGNDYAVNASAFAVGLAYETPL